MDYALSREAARRRLPRMLFDYIDGGSYSEITRARNERDMQSLTLRQRVMVDGSKLDLTVHLFDEELALPVILGPVGFAGMFARRGEVQAARAAHGAGVPFALSALGICSFEEVCRATGAPPWFQLYMIRDRGYMAELLGRVREAGASVLCFTVDLPVPAARYRDARSGILDTGLKGLARRIGQGLGRPHWLHNVQFRGKPHCFGNFEAAPGMQGGLGGQWRWVNDNFDPGVTWKDIEWVRSHWPGKVVVKGVLDPADASLAVDHGADGIVVSNHGGRQLDGVRSSISALPRIADALGDRTTILFDGGVRSGLDVLKAMSLGARAVLIGRAWAFALAAGGRAGVEALITRLRAELSVAMVLTGCPRAADAGSQLIDGPALAMPNDDAGNPLSELDRPAAAT